MENDKRSLFERYIQKNPAVKKDIKIPSIGDILTEQERPKGVIDKDINVLLLSVKEKEAGDADTSPKWTVNRIKNWCIENKIPYYIAYMGDCFVSKTDGVLKIQNTDDADGFAIDSSKTIAMVRGGAQITDSKMMTDLIAQLQRYNIFCVNNLNTIEACGDKYRTYLRLTDAGLPCPRSALVHNEDMIDHAHKKIGGEFPLVVKLLSGSKGVGVFVIDSEKSLRSVLQVMWKVSPDSELLFQEYIESEYDMRVHVLGDKVIAAMKRFVIKGDFRSNYSLGSQIESIDPDKDTKELCIKGAKAVGGIWTGVDVIFAKKDGKPYFLEINSSPGTFGIEKATKIDVVAEVMSYLSDKTNWIKVPQVCGYQEVINIIEIGEVIGKFDTGNGATCSIHAENIEVNEEKKTVSWSNNDKKFKDMPIKRKIRLIKGAVGGKIVHRVTVSLDVKFNGTLHKGVEFALDDRSGKTTPILINRRFMNEANIIVNPSKAFLLTISPFENEDKKTEVENVGGPDEMDDDNIDEQRKFSWTRATLLKG